MDLNKISEPMAMKKEFGAVSHNYIIRLRI